LGRLNNQGYYQISASDNGKRKHFLSHRFIYECFHGQIADKRIVDHINNIKTDNRLDNLQLITNRENLKKIIKREKDYQSKLELLIQRRVNGLTMKVLRKQVKISLLIQVGFAIY